MKNSQGINDNNKWKEDCNKGKWEEESRPLRQENTEKCPGDPMRLAVIQTLMWKTRKEQHNNNEDGFETNCSWCSCVK